jgi:hypothetical protein
MGKFRWILVGCVCVLVVGASGLAAERSDAQVFFQNDDTLAQSFPQFGSGFGFTSSVVLTNTSATSTVDAVGTVYFLDLDGAPLFVGLENDANDEAAQFGRLFPQAGHLVSEVEFSIPPLGSVTLTTDGLGDELLLGSARVVSNVPVGGIIRFEIPGIGIAGFGSAPPMTEAITPVRRNAGINTAVAIRNNSFEGPIAVNLELRGEDGQLLGPDAVAQREIPAEGRIAEFIDELFPDVDTSDVVGTMVIVLDEGEDGASFSAISLELGFDPGQFTSLPVSPVFHPEE